MRNSRMRGPSPPRHAPSCNAGRAPSTDFYRLGIDAEVFLAPIHLVGDPRPNPFAEPGRELAPVVVLPTGYEIGHLVPVFL